MFARTKQPSRRGDENVGWLHVFMSKHDSIIHEQKAKSTEFFRLIDSSLPKVILPLGTKSSSTNAGLCAIKYDDAPRVELT